MFVSFISDRRSHMSLRPHPRTKSIRDFRAKNEMLSIENTHIYLNNILRADLNARGEIIENEQSKSRVALNEIFAARRQNGIRN